MKKMLLTMLGVLIVLPAMARDFTYTYEGQTLTYTVIDEDAMTVETKAGSGYTPGNIISGDLILPSEVYDGDKQYTLTKIGEQSFPNCTDLASVIIPNSIETFGYDAFYNCSGLTKVEFSSIEYLCSITYESFYANPLCYVNHIYINGEEVIDLVIPESITKIGNLTFNGCTALTSVIIPKSVRSIGISAFINCSGLTSVTIGSSVVSIGNYAFNGCTSLKSIYCNNPTPAEAADNIFKGEIYTNATLYVPEGSEITYKETSPWSLFDNILTFKPDDSEGGINDVEADDAIVAVYDLRGRKITNSLENLPKGVYILRKGNETSKFAI